MDKLDQLFHLQDKFRKEIQLRSGYNNMPYQEKISCLCTAIVHEAIELQRLTNWKWWKKQIDFDKKHAKEELVDIWHFVIQASLELNLTPQELLEEYKKKNDLNHKRQETNY